MKPSALLIPVGFGPARLAGARLHRRVAGQRDARHAFADPYAALEQTSSALQEAMQRSNLPFQGDRGHAGPAVFGASGAAAAAFGASRYDYGSPGAPGVAYAPV